MTEVLTFPDPALLVTKFFKLYEVPAQYVDVTPANWDWNKQTTPLVRITEVGGRPRKWAEFQDAVLVIDVACKKKSTAYSTAQTLHSLILEAPAINPAIDAVEPIQKPIFDPEEQAQTPAYVFRVRVTYQGEYTTLTRKA